jgi:hypothetical protein
VCPCVRLVRLYEYMVRATTSHRDPIIKCLIESHMSFQQQHYIIIGSRSVPVSGLLALRAQRLLHDAALVNWY